MSLVLLLLIVSLFPERLHSQPQLDYCAAVAALGSTPAMQQERLIEAVQRASEQLDRSFDLLDSLDRCGGVCAQALPYDLPEGRREGRRRELFHLTVRHWLAVKQELCACPLSTGTPPTCERLQTELARSCEIEPKWRHGMNVRCLTKGR